MATPEPPAAATPTPPAGLAVASLVLGILSMLGSIFVVGGLLSVVGIVLGLVHIKRTVHHRGLAIGGLVTSLIGLVASCALGLAYVSMFQHIRDTVMESAADAASFENWIGAPSPDFSVTTLDGRTLTISELRGRRVIIDIWATWSPVCVRKIPHFVQLDETVEDKDLLIVGIGQDDQATLEAFIKQHGVTYPIAMESEPLPPPYGQVQLIPTTFFLDRNGIIQDVVTGYHNLEHLKPLATADDVANPIPAPPLEPDDDNGIQPAEETTDDP